MKGGKFISKSFASFFKNISPVLKNLWLSFSFHHQVPEETGHQCWQNRILEEI
jgi:hypothetical protein